MLPGRTPGPIPAGNPDRAIVSALRHMNGDTNPPLHMVRIDTASVLIAHRLSRRESFRAANVRLST